MKKACARCEVPAVADPEVPAEFPTLEDPSFDAPMTFGEYEGAVNEASGGALLGGGAVGGGGPAPEELE